jgi:Protein of unknown function (DUF3995)
VRRSEWIPYAAAAWALLFVAVTFYWAAGGLFAIDTIGGEPERLARARDSEFVAVQWTGGVLRVLAAVGVLALVRGWGGERARRPLAVVLGVGGAVLALYELAELVQHLLMAVGAIDQGDLDDTALIGHLLLWDPWWILGGVLFALAGWEHRRVSRVGSPSS